MKRETPELPDEPDEPQKPDEPQQPLEPLKPYQPPDIDKLLPDAIKASKPFDFTQALEENRKFMESIVKRLESNHKSLADEILAPLPKIDICSSWTDLGKSLIDSSKTIDTDDVLENYKTWNVSIGGLIDSFDSIKTSDWFKKICEPIDFSKTIDLEPFKPPDIDINSLRIPYLDIPPFDPDFVNKSAAAAKEALTPEVDDQPLTEQKAETAVSKLVDFAAVYGGVVELSAQTILTAKTADGHEIAISGKMTCRENFASIDLNQVLDKGKTELPSLLPPPPSSLPPPSAPAPEPAHELLTLGSYAKKFIREVDLTERSVVFKRKSTRPLHFNDREVVRQILALTLGPKANPKTGWVELPDELRKWKVEFRAPVKLPRGNQVADPHHDLTKLLHHIETDAKSGRPKDNCPKVTHIRFCRDLLPSYKQLLADYTAAINGK